MQHKKCNVVLQKGSMQRPGSVASSSLPPSLGQEDGGVFQLGGGKVAREDFLGLPSSLVNLAKDGPLKRFGTFQGIDLQLLQSF